MPEVLLAGWDWSSGWPKVTALSLILLQVGLLAAPLGDLCVITKLFSRSFGLFFLFRDVQASDLSLQWDLRLWMCLYE